MKLTERVYLVAGGQLGLGISNESDCHVYLLDGGSELALIDAGAGLDTAQILGHIAAHGFDAHRIRKVLITHYHMDHVGGAADMMQSLGAEVYCAAEAAAAIRSGDEVMTGLAHGKELGWFPGSYRLPPCEIACELAGGEMMQVGELRLRAIASPGHCQGHLAFLLAEGGQKYLFSGDTVFAGGRILLEYLPGSDMWQYRQTILELEKLGIDGILPGHGSISLRYGQSFLQAAGDQLRAGHVPANLL